MESGSKSWWHPLQQFLPLPRRLPLAPAEALGAARDASLLRFPLPRTLAESPPRPSALGEPPSKV
eukprot:9574282-Alexandrium_andersonii.AAC.1